MIPLVEFNETLQCSVYKLSGFTTIPEVYT